MMRRTWSWSAWCLPLLIAGVVGTGAVARAQQAPSAYEIGPGDVLTISVWLHPELERTVTVSPRGTISFPPIGEIEVAGMTPAQLSTRIGERLSTYLRQTTTATVTVSQFVSHSVTVTGSVAKPGRYGYEQFPSLIDVIQDAGGGVPGADLGRIQIIRRDGPSRRVLTADINRALREGTADQLPALEPGDVILVPGNAASQGAFSADAVGILGEVSHPGLYPVGEGQDLWMALALAGGPTANGNLSVIRVLTKQRDAAHAVTVNLQETLTRGNRRPYIVKPGDIVFVTPRGVSPWTVFNVLLNTTRDVLNLVVLADILRDQNSE
jgi:polysaccharide export outer membrane protein